jgi:hypothetical protein
MDDDLTREDHIARVDARTTDRVARMSEQEREELARELARRKGAAVETAPPAAGKTAPPALPQRPISPDPSVAARLTAELRATERRLDRLERFQAPGRYGGGAAPSGRYDRLVSRAERIERKLRELR